MYCLPKFKFFQFNKGCSFNHLPTVINLTAFCYKQINYLSELALLTANYATFLPSPVHFGKKVPVIDL